MFDQRIRQKIDPIFNQLTGFFIKRDITPNNLTLLGFAFGLCSFVALIFQGYLYALVFLGLNRFFDAMDGLLARQLSKDGKIGVTDFGGYLDIVLDFIFYAGFLFFFALGDAEYALSAAFLIFSFMGTASSFLAHAILVEKCGLKVDEKRQKKTFYHLGGLTEGSETIVTFVLMCLLPQYFHIIAIIFGILCWFTTATRMHMTYVSFSKVE